MTRLVEVNGIRYQVTPHPDPGWATLRAEGERQGYFSVPQTMVATFPAVVLPGRREVVVPLELLGDMLGAPFAVQLVAVEPLLSTRQVRVEFESTRWEPDPPGTEAPRLRTRISASSGQAEIEFNDKESTDGV